MIQSSRTLREAETKKGRCLVSGNGPLMFPRLLDVVAFSLWGSGFFIAADVSAGKKSGTSEHTLIFANKTAGRGCPQLGSGRQVSVFHRTVSAGII